MLLAFILLSCVFVLHIISCLLETDEKDPGMHRVVKAASKLRQQKTIPPRVLARQRNPLKSY